jgi:ribose transport system ATP-binding protein
LIDNLVAGGKAVLIVSSYFPELIGICDRIAVMHRGKLSAPRPVSEIGEHQLMMEACSGGLE